MKSKKLARSYLGDFEKYVLKSILNHGNNAEVVFIKENIEKLIEENVTSSAVYITLDRLIEKKMVTSKKIEKVKIRGGRAKRSFQVTKCGGEAFIRSIDRLFQFGFLLGSEDQ